VQGDFNGAHAQAEELLPGVIHSFEGKVVRYDSYVVG
jgi:16S rRNA (guanine1516-N2)-methyltransferase